MSRSILIGILALILWTCSPVKEASKTSAVMTQSSLDSTEYDIIIIDPGFDQWYLLNYSPSKDRLNDYYRIKNLIAVGNWNEYYRSGRYINIIDSYLDYRPEVEYGIELNRKLFWYFKYLKSKYRIRLF